jgi:MYXO-CTERM domain-containing protein
VDLDDDGDLELITSAMLGAPEVLNHDGTVFHALPGAADRFGDDSNLRDSALNTFAGHPGIGDMDGDGVRDIILGGGTPSFLISLAASREVEFDHAVGGWSGADGSFLPGWPRQNDDVAFLHAPGIADIDGDGRVEALYGSSGFFMNAWNAEGEVPAGWPKNVGGWMIGSPAIGDITGDGALEVLVTVRNGYVFAFSTTGSADQDVQWPMNHHDAFNSGNAHVPLLQQAGIPPTIDDEETGCSCQSAPAPTALALLVLLLVPLRRRLA